MNNPITNIITKWIEDNSRVIDFGCGDGSLLTELRDNKHILGYGIEIDPDGINECLKNNISVVEKDIDDGIDEFVNCNFDVAVMASSIQCLKEPNIALKKILNLSNKCIVTIPNLGYWRCRLALLLGRMPVTPSLPSSWYGTENIHLCTIKDFEDLCKEEDFIIEENMHLNKKRQVSSLAKLMPNLLSCEGVYLLARK
tara:strand:+ start:10 stop:603 length:594 start_codon:yes stop_codon:yes gene_type:complete